MRTFRLLPALLLISVLPRLALAEEVSAVSAPAEHIALPEAIQQALSKNFSIKSESFNVTIAGAQVTQQLGAFDPALTATYNNGKADDPALRDPLTGLRPAATKTSDDSYSLGLGGLLPWGMTYSLSATSDNARSTVNSFADNYASFAGVSGRQPLLRNGGFGAATAQIRIAQTNHSISQWQFRQTVIDTITSVVVAYYELDFALAQDRAARRSRDAMARLVEENRKRHAVGSLSESDVIQAEARLASQAEGVLSTAQQVRTAENTLKSLISDQHAAPLLNWHVSVDALPPAGTETGIVPSMDFAVALRQRPDYQQAVANCSVTDITYRYQRNQMLPRLDLVGSYGYNGYDASNSVSRRMVRSQDYRAYTYGVEVSVPLTFTTERGRVRAAKSQREQAKTNLDKLEQDILISVGNTANLIETTRERVVATHQARLLEEQVLAAEEKKLRAGSGSTYFVLQEQEILASLEISEARALTDYHEIVASYDRILGTTLDKRNVTLTLPR